MDGLSFERAPAAPWMKGQLDPLRKTKDQLSLLIIPLASCRDRKLDYRSLEEPAADVDGLSPLLCEHAVPVNVVLLTFSPPSFLLATADEGTEQQ